jgi:hypothetical protein
MFQVRLYEVYHNDKPDLRKIRLLPIFCSLYVLRRTANKELNSTREFWQKGLYIGPSIDTPGAVNVIVLTRGKLKVITTTAIKGVSDGGSVDPYTAVNHALPSLIQEHNVPFVDDNTTTTDDSVSLSNTEPDSSTQSIQDVDVLSNNAPTASIYLFQSMWGGLLLRF